MNEPEAAALALQGLTFLLGEPGRLNRFLTLTGLGSDDLRAAADSPELHLAVLDYLLADESLLLAFCQEARQSPQSIAPARARLAREC